MATTVDDGTHQVVPIDDSGVGSNISPPPENSDCCRDCPCYPCHCRICRDP